MWHTVVSGIDGSSEVKDEHSVKVKNKSLYDFPGLEFVDRIILVKYYVYDLTFR